jgi:hypothetical protein
MPVGYIAQGFVAHFVVSGPVGTTVWEISYGSASVPAWTGSVSGFPTRAASDPPSSPLILSYDLGLSPEYTVHFALNVNGGPMHDFSFDIIC